MSDAIVTKLSEILGAVIKPNHLMFVVIMISGGLLFNILKVQEFLGIQSEVLRYKFWIALIFFVAGGLQLLGLIQTSSAWIFRNFYQIFRNWRATKIVLSDGAGWILVLMAARQPDSTRLLAEHSAVRELRLNGLIEDRSFIITGNSFQYFTLTEIGLSAAIPRLKNLSSQDDLNIKALLDVVTGRQA